MEKIKIRRLQKSYTDRKKNSTVALYQCDLDVHDGEFLVLLGESGCGKTSLLKVIAGLESYDFGDIYIDDVDATKLEQIDKNMSYVSQRIVLFPHKTVYENIMEPLTIQRYSREEKVKRVKELSELLNLDILLTRRPRELSGGQQQRVAIARALAKNPSLCLFDEPMSALDPQYHTEIIDLLKYVHKMTSATYIYSTHNQTEAFRLADRIAIMNNRKVEQIGTLAEITNNPSSLFVTKFLTSVFVLHLGGTFSNGHFINNDYGINVPINVKEEYKERLEGKVVVAAIKRSDIKIFDDGVDALVVNSDSNNLFLSLDGQEFFIDNPDLIEYKNSVKIKIDFSHIQAFFDGVKITL